MALLRHIVMYVGDLPPDADKFKVVDNGSPVTGNDETIFLSGNGHGER